MKCRNPADYRLSAEALRRLWPVGMIRSGGEVELMIRNVVLSTVIGDTLEELQLVDPVVPEE